MRKPVNLLCALAILMGCSQTAFDPSKVEDATPQQIAHVEPPCWWIGMNASLQLLVNGPDISGYDVSIEGLKGVSVEKVHKADSPNYLFVDVKINSTNSGTCYLVFSKEGQAAFKYAYEIGARRDGSAQRQSFTTSDAIYLIMPDRFANGDPTNDDMPGMTDKADRNAFFGRHGGDIQGIIDHLDYIADLGMTAIWTTPMLEDNDPDGSYHGYAASNYYMIDSRFGTNELYREMVSKAHEKGIKVIMDMVPNHSGCPHWWFEDTPFKDWIHRFDQYTGSNIVFSSNMDPNASKHDLHIHESGWFSPGMPDMNMDNEFMLKYFQMWAIWWTEYADLDGFRVDTYPYNEKEPMSRWCKAVTDEYPDFNIVGEVWTSSIPQLAYWQKDNRNKDGFNSNLPSIMDFPLYDAICAGVPKDNPGWGEGMTAIYDCLSHDFVYEDLSHMMIFPSNHDTDRIGDVLRRDKQRMKIVMTMMATMRGIPQIFSGDEMMFVSKDRSQGHGGLRVDFPGGWNGDSENLFTPEGRAASVHTTDGSIVPEGQNAELYDYARKLFQWRKGKSVIHNGKTLHFLSRDNSYGYFRYNDNEAVFVYINNSSEPRNIPWSSYSEITEGLHGGVDVVTGQPVSIDDNTVAPAHSVLIVEFDNSAVSCGKKAPAAHAEWAYNAVIYEMNVRQYTPEGTLRAAARELPRLADLGVDVIWLMPIHPIGVEGRKGSLGSYYAPSDYCAVNPEFGTMKDFDNFLAKAHKLGLKVILDMVCNHTSPDAVWNNEKGYDWYVRDSLGNTIVEYDWTDIAKLDYSNPDLRNAMEDALRFWIDKGVDGYRCDAAWSLPTDFWAGIFPEMKAENPDLYFLAEAEKPELNIQGGFDAAYAWNLHHTLNSIAQGKAGIDELKEALDSTSRGFPKETFMLSFTSNHDENSWAGTEFERMGDAWKVMAVLTYTLPGCQPLIYTGQEVGWNKRFEFFEKDITPDWTANEFTAFYKDMNKLYHDNPALAAGERGGDFQILSEEDGTLVFSRSVPGNKVTVSAQLVEPWAYSITVE